MTMFHSSRIGLALIVLGTIAMAHPGAHAQNDPATPPAGMGLQRGAGGAQPVYMRINGSTEEFRGNCTQKGLEGWIELQGVRYSWNRDVDPLGRPASGIHGGKVTIEKRLDNSTLPLQALTLTQFKPCKVELMIAIQQPGAENKFYKMSLEDAYVVSYEFDKTPVVGENNGNRRPGVDVERITFSGRKLSIEMDGKVAGALENEWPK